MYDHQIGEFCQTQWIEDPGNTRSKTKAKPRTRSRSPLRRKYDKKQIKQEDSPEYNPFAEQPTDDAAYFASLLSMEEELDAAEEGTA